MECTIILSHFVHNHSNWKNEHYFTKFIDFTATCTNILYTEVRFANKKYISTIIEVLFNPFDFIDFEKYSVFQKGIIQNTNMYIIF